MTTPITQIPKPEASQFKDGRKLFLVPIPMLPPQPPEDAVLLLEKYWSEVRDQIDSLERSLGKVTHVFHEALHVGGSDGMDLIQQINPQGSSFIQAMCLSEVQLEPTEDISALEASTDWQRCLSMGLVSQTVRDIAVDGYQQSTNKRYQHIASKLDELIGEQETGAIFIREDHRVQFPSDIQVFYVAPPALDSLKRWLDNLFRTTTASHTSQKQDENTDSKNTKESSESGQGDEVKNSD